MSEMSDMFKLVNQMELAKKARVGTSLTYFDVIELLGELKLLKSCIAELESENGRLQESWLWETVCPDGSLRPKVSELLLNLDGWKERSNGWESIVETLNTRIAELEAKVEVQE